MAGAIRPPAARAKALSRRNPIRSTSSARPRSGKRHVERLRASEIGAMVSPRLITAPLLLRLQTRRLQQRRPFLDLDCDEVGELLRRLDRRLEAELGQDRFHLR